MAESKTHTHTDASRVVVSLEADVNVDKCMRIAASVCRDARGDSRAMTRTAI